MTHSIRNKLFKGGFVVLGFILLMIAGNLAVVGVFKQSTVKLIGEYQYLVHSQEVKFTLVKMQQAFNVYAITSRPVDIQRYKQVFQQARETSRHSWEMRMQAGNEADCIEMNRLLLASDSVANQLFQLDADEQPLKASVLLKAFHQLILQGHTQIDNRIQQAQNQIDKYQVLNKTAIRHSTITLPILGVLLVIFMLFGGWFLIHRITEPIQAVINTTRRISQGELNAKVEIQSNDEFQKLAYSFNEMVDTLEKTTVPKIYLNDIMRNMYDALEVSEKPPLLITKLAGMADSFWMKGKDQSSPAWSFQLPLINILRYQPPSNNTAAVNAAQSIPLTKREREVLQQIADDKSNQQIADTLRISLRTVETHRRNLMQKLQTKTVVALLKKAARQQLISLD